MAAFAANLTIMFTEWPFLDRFAAAADAGFTNVEYLFPYEHKPEVIAARLQACGLTQVTFNMPPGDWAKGERGLACLPERFDEMRRGVALALEYAQATGTKKLHLPSGIGSMDDAGARSAYEKAVRYAAEELALRDVMLLLEPISNPGFFLNDFGYAEKIAKALERFGVKLLFDIYHRQMLHGNVAKALSSLLPLTGHIQVASVPDRCEPIDGELNYTYLFDLIERMGYKGFIGLEYTPRSGTVEGLGWMNTLPTHLQ